MNTETLLNVVFNGVVLVAAFLIKMELHDIKSRIVRLENLFLHPNNKHHVERILAPIFLLLLFTPSETVFAQTKVTGGSVWQPPSTFELCGPPKFCPYIVDADITNPSRMYGSDPSCRMSVTGGSTWTACTTAPSVTTNIPHVAVASNGAVLFGGNDGGIFIIRRSLDKTASWSTVYTGATGDSSAITKSRLQCAKLAPVCVGMYRDNAGNAQIGLVSNDNGATWSVNTLTSSTVEINSISISNDGTIGIAAPRNPLGVAGNFGGIFVGGTWIASIPWQSAVGGWCYATYVQGANLRAICKHSSLGFDYTIRDENGVTQNSFTLSGILTGLQPYQANSQGSFVYIPSNSSSGLNILESLDGALSFYSIGYAGNTMTTGFFNTFELNGCLYFSYSEGSAGRLFAVCP